MADAPTSIVWEVFDGLHSAAYAGRVPEQVPQPELVQDAEEDGDGGTMLDKIRIHDDQLRFELFTKT